MKSNSLTFRLLTIVLGFSCLFTAISAVSSFYAFRHAFVQAALEKLSLRTSERARGDAAALDSLRHLTDSATLLLGRELATMSDASVESDFARFFRTGQDGVARSVPELFTGIRSSSGQRVYAMGGFQPHAASLSHADKKLVLAGMAVSRQIGESKLTTPGQFGFTTARGGLVVFSPKAEDKLQYIRAATGQVRETMSAQPELDGPARNPSGQMDCQRVRVIRSQGGLRPVMRLCFSPAYVSGRFVGVWGTVLGDRTNRATGDLKGTEDLIVSLDGVLIGFSNGQQVTRPTLRLIDHYEKSIGLRATLAEISAKGADSGVTRSRDGRNLVGYAKVRGASWYLLELAPLGPIERQAAMSALGIVSAGLLSMMGSAALIFWFTRRLIVVPLERLAQTAGREALLRDVADLETRPDEIGALSRRLAGERAQNDQLLATLEDRVAERTEELENANRAKSSFLANMSHELRTPLNGVVAVSTLLEDQLETPREKHMASLVSSSARLLEKVLTDILDVSKIDAGQMTLTCEPFDLESAVTRIAELHLASAEANGLDLRWSVAPDAAGGYLGDEVRVTQILSNLLSNAVKFTQAGEISLTAESCPEGLRLSVRDTGIGFAPEAAERLFQPFEQADATITRRFGGTGLGLSICSALTAQMGGTIAARSAEGEGSTFRVTLPLPRAELGRAGVVAPAAAANDSTDDAPARVLLAEDHPTNQQVVSLILEGVGVELTIVEDGLQAVNAFKAGAFDLVLMDMQMPVMDGITAIREIRAYEAQFGLAPTPIAALTANAMPEHLEATREAGGTLHLSKPIRPDALIQAVVDAVAESRAARPVAAPAKKPRAKRQRRG